MPCELLSLTWVVRVGNQRTGSTKKQNYLSILRGLIDFSVYGVRRDVKEISRTEGDGILFSRITFESNRSRDDVAIDIVISVVMPPRNYSRVTP